MTNHDYTQGKTPAPKDVNDEAPQSYTNECQKFATQMDAALLARLRGNTQVA